MGRPSIPRLGALDLDSVGRATNPWPSHVFNNRYLGGNPIWTRDSIGIRGRDGKQKFWIAIGTNRHDELLAALEHTVADARARSTTASDTYHGPRASSTGLVRRSVG